MERSLASSAFVSRRGTSYNSATKRQQPRHMKHSVQESFNTLFISGSGVFKMMMMMVVMMMVVVVVMTVFIDDDGSDDDGGGGGDDGVYRR